MVEGDILHYAVEICPLFEDDEMLGMRSSFRGVVTILYLRKVTHEVGFIGRLFRGDFILSFTF